MPIVVDKSGNGPQTPDQHITKPFGTIEIDPNTVLNVLGPLTEAQAQGIAGDLAKDQTLQSSIDKENEILQELQTPVDNANFVPLLNTSGMQSHNVSRTGAGVEVMVGAQAGEVTRLYRYAITVPGAGTVEIRSGTDVRRRHKFPSSNGGGIVRDLSSRPYAVTDANTALNFYWSGSGEAHIDFEYTRG